MRVGCGCCKIRGPRSQRCHTHTRFSSQAAIGCGHEGSALFVTGQDQLDAGGPQ